MLLLHTSGGGRLPGPPAKGRCAGCWHCRCCCCGCMNARGRQHGQRRSCVSIPLHASSRVRRPPTHLTVKLCEDGCTHDASTSPPPVRACAVQLSSLCRAAASAGDAAAAGGPVLVPQVYTWSSSSGCVSAAARGRRAAAGDLPSCCSSVCAVERTRAGWQCASGGLAWADECVPRHAWLDSLTAHQ
jgi:hypothetical protein